MKLIWAHRRKNVPVIYLLNKCTPTKMITNLFCVSQNWSTTISYKVLLENDRQRIPKEFYIMGFFNEMLHLEYQICDTVGHQITLNQYMCARLDANGRMYQKYYKNNNCVLTLEKITDFRII